MIHHVLLVTSLAIVFLCCCVGALGAWRMREPTQALHYLSLPTDLGALFLAIAVYLETGWGSTTAKTIAICVILVATNSVGTHATARAIRVRELGHWEPHKEDGVEFVPKESKG
ncbi:MAG TPA: monovalent cation/H(+) antiporter subunit G [Silvibacterium sp.]|nr:monovalent cation/H(+) antiporter subunit G [Silvibacterium sp.]